MTNKPDNIDKEMSRNSKRPVIEDPNLLFPWTFDPIGVVHSNYKNHFDTPRQPGVDEKTEDAWIYLKKGMQNCVRDLQGFDYAWIIFVFNYSRGCKDHVVPPRDTEHRGVFSTRSPHRPNPIGMSCVKVLNIKGTKILIRDHDLLHGTPILDIKPYLPYCDSHPNAKAGWVDDLKKPGPDHRWE